MLKGTLEADWDVGVGYPGIDSELSYFMTGVLGLEGERESKVRSQSKAWGLWLILIDIKIRVVMVTV